jgi:hypothetical protein
MCTYPQRFEYNINLEFNADALYEAKLRRNNMIKRKSLDAQAIIKLGEQRNLMAAAQ